MKKLVILSLLIAVCACTAVEEKNEIALFNELAFSLHDNEAVANIDSKVKARYAAHFNNSLIQIPLFRYLRHDNYELFIGIPYRTSLQAMRQRALEKGDSLRTNTTLKSDSLSYYQTYKRKNTYLAEYALDAGNGSLVYIAAIVDSTKFTPSTFSELDIPNRIIK